MGPFKHVFQFANVAGEAVALESGQRLGCQPGSRLVGLFGQAAQDIVGDVFNIFTAFAQWRYAKFDDVEAVVKVLAETLRRHFDAEILMGGAQDANVHHLFLLPPHRAHGFFLNRAQQFHLHRQWQVCHFVQKQRAAVGNLEQPGLVFVGDLIFWHLAILNTTVANATFFATTAPIFVILISWAVLRVTIARSTLAGLALCMAGGAALIGQSMQIAPDRIAGDVYGVITAFFFALYFLGVEKARRSGGSAGRVTFELSLVTAAGLFVATIIAERQILPTTPEAIAALVALAFISHAGGQGLLSVALGRLPAVFSSLVIFIEAVAAALFGWLILSEALTLVQAMGGALILAGIFVARPRRNRSPLPAKARAEVRASDSP